jgi:hypothetical protein
MPGVYGLAAHALSKARRDAKASHQEDADRAKQDEQQEFARLALMASLSGQGIVPGDQRENITAEMPGVSTIGGPMPRQQGTPTDTGIMDPSRYVSLGRAGGKDYYKDKAQEIAAQREAARKARIEEALKNSTIDVNTARADDLRRPRPISAEPNDVTMLGGKRIYTPRSKAAGMEAPSPVAGSQNQYRDMSAVSTLRGQYNGEQTVKDAAQVATAYRKIKSAANNPSAAGDLSLIFGYMRMLDPGSTVREGEFANAQNSAGVPDQVKNAYNKALKGERLNPNQRQDFLRQAEGLVGAQRQSLQGLAKRYAAIAQRNGMDPRDVIFDPFGEEQQDESLPFPHDQ